MRRIVRRHVEERHEPPAFQFSIWDAGVDNAALVQLYSCGLSILYLRCGTGSQLQTCPAWGVSFNSLFEMRNCRWVWKWASVYKYLSILYLRCGEDTGAAVILAYAAFQFSIWDAVQYRYRWWATGKPFLSILYLRCTAVEPDVECMWCLFQFSIWDAWWLRCTRRRRVKPLQLSILYLRCSRLRQLWGCGYDQRLFQFSIWDAL